MVTGHLVGMREVSSRTTEAERRVFTFNQANHERQMIHDVHSVLENNS